MAMNKFKRDPVHNSEMLVEIIDVTTKSTIKVCQLCTISACFFPLFLVAFTGPHVGCTTVKS